jgi:2-dehydro-3-deoxygluconokinase
LRDGIVDVLTIGEALVCFASPAGAIDTGVEFIKSLGGAEGNTAIGLSRLGDSAAWISRVSSDPLGESILRNFQAEGVDTSGVIRDSTKQTGIMLKERFGPHETQVYYYRSDSAAAALSREDFDGSIFDSVVRFHVTGIDFAIGEGPRELVMNLIGLAAARGVRVSFDPNFRPRLLEASEAAEHYRRAIPYVTDLLCNETEATLISGLADPEAAAAKIADLGPTAVIVKRGSSGAVAVIDGRRYDVPAWPAPNPVDPVGAGDAFNAGWIHSRLRDLPVETGLALAAFVAAQVVQHPGDYEGFPDRATVDAWLSAQETKSPTSHDWLAG